MNKLKYLLIFVLGLILGCGITVVIVGKILQRQDADKYSMLLMDQAYLLKEIHLEREDEIAKRIEHNLPTYVLAINQNEELKNSELTQEALWSVKSFYDCSKKEIPKNISEIMRKLPPQPESSCSMKDRKMNIEK